MPAVTTFPDFTYPIEKIHLILLSNCAAMLCYSVDMLITTEHLIDSNDEVTADIRTE
jgi:hypothetical protein